jgi:lipopolysaccharide biosynthesis glycosyltransferase
VDPVLLCAADERYAMPLTVTLLSALHNLKVGSHLEVYLVDGGITPETRQRMESSLVGQPLRLHWIEANGVDLSDLSVSHHISHTAYLRLLADRWVPETLDKVIYLDSDLVIRHSLTELWEADLQDNYCLAVPDIACPFVDARQVSSEQNGALPYLASWRPIPNYDALGVSEHSLYFNSGVMVLNLRRWREERLSERLLQVLRENAEHVWCWDQYALNTVCAGAWGKLPMRWNVGGHLYEYPSVERSPVPPTEYREMTEDPAIIHFTTEFKPWDFYCTHPQRAVFFEFLDKTRWQGWRPVRPPFRIQNQWTRFAVWACRNWIIQYRKWVMTRKPS